MTSDERKPRSGEPRGARGALSLSLDLALLAPVCALYAAARVWRLGATCLWFDEIFGVHAAEWHGWGDGLRFVALDLIHPPLFYALLKVWIAVTGAGASAWWLRMFAVVASVCAVVPLALLARELRLSAGATRLAVLLAAVSGILIKYAQELRMYSLLLLLATCSLWLFARLCNSTARARDGDAAGRGGEARRGDKSRRAGDASRVACALFVVNLLLVYTHYFGWLVVALEVAFVALFARERLKVFASSVAALAACFAPWVGAVWRAARGVGGGFEQNLGWAPRPRAWEIFEPYLRLHEPFRAQQQSDEPAVVGVSVVLAIVVFAPPLVAVCWRVFARRNASAADGAPVGVACERRAVVFLAFFALAPVVAAFALAQVLPQSIWGVRHLIVAAPAYLLLAAHALASLRPQWLAVTLKIVLGCWLALAALVALMRPAPAPVWCAWGALALDAARDEETARGGATKIYAFEDLAAYQVWYALRAAGETRLRVAVVRDAPGVAQDRAFFLPRGFDEILVERAGEAVNEEEFWVVWRGAAGDEEYPPLVALRARGYAIARLYERDADGQKAFVALARRR
ncbi:MAG: hypothetical protein ABR563_07035 [Pyrinomonadaceae bacterium]